MSFYSRAHYRRVSPRQETKAEEAKRARELEIYRKASMQALAECRAKWPELTVDNFAEADRFREARTQELVRAAS